MHELALYAFDYALTVPEYICFQEVLVRERKDVEKRIMRLVDAIEQAGDAAALAITMRELETRFDKLFTGVTCTAAPAWLAVGDRRP